MNQFNEYIQFLYIAHSGKLYVVGIITVGFSVLVHSIYFQLCCAAAFNKKKVFLIPTSQDSNHK